MGNNSESAAGRATVLPTVIRWPYLNRIRPTVYGMEQQIPQQTKSPLSSPQHLTPWQAPPDSVFQEYWR